MPPQYIPACNRAERLFARGFSFQHWCVGSPSSKRINEKSSLRLIVAIISAQRILLPAAPYTNWQRDQTVAIKQGSQANE
jgi:hypothetical protein